MIKRNSKLLIVGSTGYIGKSLISYARINKLDVLGASTTGRDDGISLDLVNPFDFDYDILGPDSTVLLTAAISSPDFCAREFDRAWAVNVTGTSQFVERGLYRGAKVIFFSTDTVYGERSDFFSEDTECTPMGEYARMKAEVENRFCREVNFKSIRLSYVFSREDKFSKYLIDSVSRGEEAELYHPFFRSIIYRQDVVDGVFALVRQWETFPENVINFGGPQLLSRIEFAECFRRNVLPSLKFQNTQPSDDFFKNRPRVIAMRSDVLHRLLGRSARTLDQAVSLEFHAESVN
jgi:dTDP-4-dehydrorhamnose reductase